MMETLTQIWKNRDLRNKILFTLGILLLVRIISHIPLPQIDRSELANFLNKQENQVFGVLSVFTGGSLSQLSIDLLGVGPYITASIVVQLLTKAIPTWDALNKEGNAGREKLNQYTRYLTVPMALIQGYGTLALLRSQNVLTLLSTADIISILVIISVTSIFVMWLGELISEKGIGNGISMIIALGIVARLPQQFANTFTTLQSNNVTGLLLFAVISLLTIVIIVIVNEAQRNIPITYARRSAGSSSAVDSYLPLRVNTAGVVPIIFALSFLTFPAIIARFLSTARSTALVNGANAVTNFLNNQLYYGIIYFVLVFVFTFFYTYIIFQPQEVAENLQKQGSFIPGVRPGTETVSFLSHTITRITVIGAIFLAVIAVLPIIVNSLTSVQNLVIGGTSILILVSVIIETSRQLTSQIIMRRYDTAG